MTPNRIRRGERSGASRFPAQASFLMVLLAAGGFAAGPASCLRDRALSVDLLSPPEGAASLAPPVVLSVRTAPSTAPSTSSLDVTFYARRGPSPDFTIVVLPDTQYYSESAPETFLAQTRFIVDRRDELNIAAVFHLGDIVERADREHEWQRADAAISILEEVPDLPYGLVVGNHDQWPDGDPAGTAAFNRYFPVSRYADRPWYGGHYGDDNDNHYILFGAGDLAFVALFLEFDRAADPDVLAWADGVLKRHDDRRAIVCTHYVIWSDYLGNDFSKQGRAVYESLRGNPNLFLMLGGHFCETGRRADPGAGGTIYTILSDYQCQPNFGNGFLRLLHFSPTANRIYVSTYSPTRGQQLTLPMHQFSLAYSMYAPTDFSPLGRVAAAPDSTASFTWSGLDAAGTYEWYVTVSNGGFAQPSDRWTFATGADFGDVDDGPGADAPGADAAPVADAPP